MPDKRQNADPEQSKLTFEQALNRLEETVQALETSGLSLDDATRLFEEGMKLARVCSEMPSFASPVSRRPTASRCGSWRATTPASKRNKAGPPLSSLTWTKR